MAKAKVKPIGKVKMGQIVGAEQFLGEILNQDITGTGALMISKFIKTELNPAAEIFEKNKKKVMEEVLDEIITSEEHADQLTEEKPEEMKQFNEKLQELLDEDVEIDHPILDIDKLGSDFKFHGGKMFMISWMFGV